MRPTTVQLQPFCSNSAGSIAVTAALLMTLLLGFAGAAVDYGQMVYLRSRLQTALDAPRWLAPTR